MPQGRGRELWHHAVIAGVVAITILLFEVVLIKQHEHWLRALGCVIAFAIVFVLIYVGDSFWEAHLERRAIRLPTGGNVDAYWLDVISDGLAEGSLLGGSIVRIKSFSGEFQFDGLSYMLGGNGSRKWGD